MSHTFQFSFFDGLVNILPLFTTISKNNCQLPGAKCEWKWALFIPPPPKKSNKNWKTRWPRYKPTRRCRGVQKWISHNWISYQRCFITKIPKRVDGKKWKHGINSLIFFLEKVWIYQKTGIQPDLIHNTHIIPRIEYEEIPKKIKVKFNANFSLMYNYTSWYRWIWNTPSINPRLEVRIKFWNN